MADKKIIQGGDLMLFFDGKSIAEATSHSLSIQFESTETTTKDQGGYWKNFDYKSASWTATSENLMSDSTDGYTFKDLFDAAVSKEQFDVVFGPKISAQASSTEVPEGGWDESTANYYSGKVIITSIELNAPNGDNATYTINLQGCGALTYHATAS